MQHLTLQRPVGTAHPTAPVALHVIDAGVTVVEYVDGGIDYLDAVLEQLQVMPTEQRRVTGQALLIALRDQPRPADWQWLRSLVVGRLEEAGL